MRQVRCAVVHVSPWQMVPIMVHTSEVVAELRIRIAACRKQAVEAAKWDWEKQQHVCERTAQELERIVYWITEGSHDTSNDQAMPRVRRGKASG